VIEYTGQVCNVYPYSPKYKPRTNIPIVKAITAYDSPSVETFILCLNQALYFGNEMQKWSNAPDALLELIQHISIPSAIVTDGAKALTLGEWKTIARKYHVKSRETEPYSPWQNRAKSGIRELK
jgi:hypothetical protein